MWLFIIFIIVPIIEIGLFIKLGSFFGFWNTIGIVFLTAILGSFLVKSQGSAALSNIKSNLQTLRDPTESLAHGALILIAGVLLLTPGFFTDTVGLLLMVPKFRSYFFSWIKSRLVTLNLSTNQNVPPREDWGNGSIVEGEFSDLSKQKNYSENDNPKA